MAITPGNVSDTFIHAMSEAEEAGLKNFASAMDKVAVLIKPETIFKVPAEKPVMRVIDLLRRYDIAYTEHTLAPRDERWSAVDLNTYDASEGIGACIGRGPTTHEALIDLLEQIAEIAATPAIEPMPPPVRTRTIYSSGVREEPDDIVTVPEDFDADLEDDRE